MQVYRRRWVIHIERISKEKANGASVQVGVHPSKVKDIFFASEPIIQYFEIGGNSEAQVG